MTIVILGWGSLVWDPRDLPHYGPWQLEGPMLPIELSRVSTDGRLTLVLDSSAQDVGTRYAQSPRTNIHDAIADLQQRESTTRKNIGFVVNASERSTDEFAQRIDEWCTRKSFAGCVWTALRPNFEEKTTEAFSVENAVRYLERLGKSARENALKYIRNAPAEVDTPVRREVMRRWPPANSSLHRT
jgi:hypothetical protein